MKHFIKMLSSNFRAVSSKGILFTGKLFPVWADGNADNWRFQWAAYYLYHVFGYELPLN